MGSIFSTQFPKYLDGCSLRTIPMIQQKFNKDRTWNGQRKGMLFFIAIGLIIFITIQIYEFIINYKGLPNTYSEFIISCIILSLILISTFFNAITEKYFPGSIFRQRAVHLCFYLIFSFGNSFNKKEAQVVPYYLIYVSQFVFITNSFATLNWIGIGLIESFLIIFNIIYRNIFNNANAFYIVMNILLDINFLIARIVFQYYQEKIDKEVIINQRLKEKEAKKWKNLLDKLPEGFFIISKSQDQKLIYYNQSLQSQLKIEEHFWNYSSNNIENDENTDRIYDKFKAVKAKNDDYSLFDIINNYVNLDFANNSTMNFIMKKEKDFHFQIHKFMIPFNNERCNAFMVEDHTTMVELENQKLKSKYQRRYLASITHDLKTPINGIMGILRIILEKIQNIEIRGLIESALKSSELLLFLIRDILDLSQIEAKTIKLNIVKTDIRRVVNECIDILINDFRQKEIRLEVNINSNVPVDIMTDENRYKQILINLLSNAFKHTPRSGEVKIKLKYNESTHTLKTSVKDTGLGIKEEDQKNLFKPFGKIEDKMNVNPNSVGLGLNICKKLSKKLGGSIGVKSIYGSGSKFFFSVDTDSQGTMNNQKIKSIEEIIEENGFDQLFHFKSQLVPSNIRNCNCPKVLIVDDVPTNLFVLETYLKSVNVSCDKAMDGREAVEAVQRRWNQICCEYYHIIYMDISMPVLDGMEATKMIRSMEQNLTKDSTPIIACTANSISEESLIIEYLNNGFNDIKCKPITKQETVKLLMKYRIIND